MQDDERTGRPTEIRISDSITGVDGRWDALLRISVESTQKEEYFDW